MATHPIVHIYHGSLSVGQQISLCRSSTPTAGATVAPLLLNPPPQNCVFNPRRDDACSKALLCEPFADFSPAMPLLCTYSLVAAPLFLFSLMYPRPRGVCPEIETHLYHDMSRQRIDRDFLQVHPERLGEPLLECHAVPLDLLDGRELLVAAALGELVDGKVVAGRARDAEGAGLRLL